VAGKLKITKFVHSCVLVETTEKVALFDPGAMSAEAVSAASFERLDLILITHIHADHYNPELIKQLVLRFPQVRITTNKEVKADLATHGITASDQAPDGVKFFDSPHESVQPLFPQPEERGFHFQDQFTHPGDCHSFKETKAVLALPMTGPWGSTIRAINLAFELKPKYVVPIHDWHWREEARLDTYSMYEHFLGEKGITFLKLETGVPVEIEA
jgi:L-ascorbate metabolism protein UlaG (beta-lactamase superfamily)